MSTDDFTIVDSLKFKISIEFLCITKDDKTLFCCHVVYGNISQINLASEKLQMVRQFDLGPEPIRCLQVTDEKHTLFASGKKGNMY